MPLHVFESAGNIKPVGPFPIEDKPDNFFESYAWTLSDQSANNLKGDIILMHKDKSSPCRESGIIQDWYRDENNDVVLIYQRNPQYEGTKPPKDWPRQDWTIV